MAITNDARLLDFVTPLGADALQVVRVRGTEQVSGLYAFHLELVSETENVDFAKLVGKPATLHLRLADASDRLWHGRIGRFAQVGAEDSRYSYRAELVPWPWLLQHTADSRIFQDKSVPDIVEAVFKARGFADYRLSLAQAYPARVYCVQYRESDWAFVSRLLEEEGIFYFFEHATDKHTLVLADDASAVKPCSGKSSVPYRPAAGLTEGDDITSWMQAMTVVPAKVALTDYDFTQPATSLLASSPTIATVAKQDALDLYDHPGGHAAVTTGEGRAKLRMQEWEARQVRVEGGGDCRTLAAGSSFTLSDHFRDDYNAEYLLLSVQHDAGNNLPWAGTPAHYENRFTCQPKAVVYRPPRTTPRPQVAGTQTALVVGPAGEEIYTDAHGRIKVQFPWDRVGGKDDKSSCWMRVAQGWAGLSWGAVQLPRIGQEVLVSFMEGDPDQPVVTGRVYNAQKTPTYALPDNKTQSGFKSRSTPNGSAENFNELRFEDKKDAEEVFFQAEKDFNRVVKNDDTLSVGHDQTREVKNDASLTIGNDYKSEVKNDRIASVGNDRKEDVKNDYALSVGNDHTVEVKNNLTQKVSNKHELTATTSTELKVGGNSILIDSSGITIKVGANSVVIDSAGVTIKGTMVTVKGNATAEISSGGVTTVKGATVMIN